MNFKIVFTSLLFTLLFISQSFAQDVYEYATVFFEVVKTISDKYDVVIIKDRIERIHYKLPLLYKDSLGGEEYVIAKVKEMNKDGWEVYSACKNNSRNSNIFFPLYTTYYLRKKILYFQK